MFQSLDEQVQTAEGGRLTTKALLVRFVSAAAILLVLFGGLYLATVPFE